MKMVGQMRATLWPCLADVRLSCVTRLRKRAKKWLCGLLWLWQFIGRQH